MQMNPDLKGHIEARLDKVHEGTSNIYNEEFFKEQTVIANALDNIKARLFIDQKCVMARTPLLDSGTLGPKGHV
jgi:molybdopterin/thiamine biosynthesis adenylyltransferase